MSPNGCLKQTIKPSLPLYVPSSAYLARPGAMLQVRASALASLCNPAKICRLKARGVSLRHYMIQSPSSPSLSKRVAPGLLATKVPEPYVEGIDPEIARFQEHQRTAARPSPAEESRTLMKLAKHAVLSTYSKSEAPGYPFGSVVEVATDDKGRPILATSSLSPHTRDLREDGRCSLVVTATSFKSLQDARFTLVGTMKEVPGEERAEVRATFLAQHPGAFYVDFGDFSFFRMDDLQSGRLVGGFGRVYKVSIDDYSSTGADPVAQFSGPVCSHMNADHEEDTKAMVRHYINFSVDKAQMLDIDRLGINIQATRNGEQFKIRLPFIRPAEDRKSIKEVLVEMTRTAKAAQASA